MEFFKTTSLEENNLLKLKNFIKINYFFINLIIFYKFNVLELIVQKIGLK